MGKAVFAKDSTPVKEISYAIFMDGNTEQEKRSFVVKEPNFALLGQSLATPVSRDGATGASAYPKRNPMSSYLSPFVSNVIVKS